MITTHITQDEYITIKRAEEISGKTVKELQLVIPDKINNKWGVYRILNVYSMQSEAYKYFAHMECLEDASGQFDATARAMAFNAIAKEAESGRRPCDICGTKIKLIHSPLFEQWLCQRCYEYEKERMERVNANSV